MKKQLLFSALLFVQISFGQGNTLTKVFGTKCSLVPPPGFVAATAFSGFQNIANGASIMVNEIPAAYQTIVDGFSAEALHTKGMKLISKQIIDFNHSRATLINVTQPANGTTYLKQMLVFGDAKGTVLVNGIYPEASKEIEAKMKEALLSTVYTASQNDNPQDAATFTVDITETDMKLINYMSGSLVYSTDGKIPTEKPSLIVGNSIGKIAPGEQKTYAEYRLKKLPGGESSVIRESKKISVDNLNGYEIVADGRTKDDKPELVYEVMLFNEIGDYYIIIGRAKEEFEKNLTNFRKITKTFKRK